MQIHVIGTLLLKSVLFPLEMGTMEARENTKVTLFTLSLAEENTIIIGGAYLLNWSFSRTDPQKGKIQ